jgi:hypothetical protein
MQVSSQMMEALKRLEPAKIAEDAVRVEREATVMGRRWDLPDRLVTIMQAGLPIKALLYGCIGVGKTTEFARWQNELKKAGLSSITLNIITNQGRPEQASLRLESTAMPFIPGTYTAALLLDERWLAYSKTVFLIDGLDLLSAEEALQWFGPGGFLSRVTLSLVATAPHTLVMLRPKSDIDPNFQDAWHLPAFPVIQEDGNPNQLVMQHLASGFARRFERLQIIESHSTLERLAFSSAGIPRHMVLLLRAAVLAGSGMGKVLPVHVLDAERELRQDLEHGLKDGDETILKEVMRTKQFRGEPRLANLGAVVPFEGKERRYWLPHPLLWPLVSP